MTRKEVELAKRRNTPTPPCPCCSHKHTVGRVSTFGKVMTYYCRQCDIEFDTRHGGVTGVFSLTAEGNRFALSFGGVK